MKRRGISVSARITLNKLNLNEAVEIVNFLDKNTLVDRISIERVIPSGRALDNKLAIYLKNTSIL